MPQISHIKYKDVIEAGRFDAEYFKPNLLEMISNLEKKGCFVLGENAQIKGGKRLPLGEDFSDEGIPYIRAEDIKNGFVDYENSPKIPEELHKKLINYQTKKDDNLITIVGNSVGDVGIVKFDLDKCNLTENACKIINLNLINPDSFFAFMLSSYGQNQIHREKVGTAQPKLALERIRRFRIPKFTDNIQQEISKIIENAYDKQQKSKQLYQEAEDLLLTELGLKKHTISHTLTFSTTKKAVDEAGRYDADYFQPKYDELIEKIENYKGSWDELKNCIKVIDKNFIPEDEKLYKYIALANVSAQGFISDCEENYGKELPTRARRLVKEGNVIVSSIEGSLSSCAVIENEFDGALCSNGFYVLDSDYFNSECLLVLFKSNIIQTLLKKGCSGTILTAISKDELNKIQIPLIDQKIQKEISDKIKESFKLRNESKQLLEQAKKMVEDEIEKE